MKGASDFDVRTVTIEGLTSVRYLLSRTEGIVTVSAAIWSPGLSWSHDTLHFDERVGSLSGESVSERLGGGVRRCRADFLYSGQLFRAGTLDGVALTSKSFLIGCPTKPAFLDQEASRSVVSLAGDRGFESFSLQRRVSCEPDFLDQEAVS